MRCIYLSPHLDDAILSCGGAIFTQREAGIHVEIWNWMCGFPPADQPLSELARSVHAGWTLGSAQETITLRRAEDASAAKRVDATPRYFNFLDCIYRVNEKGQALYGKNLFAPPPPADERLVDEIAAKLTENLAADDLLLAPLSIGKHPDHILVRRAAEQTGHPLHYYGDIPYLFWKPEQLAEMTQGLKAEQQPFSEKALQIWQDAVAAYGSQISSLFSNEGKMREALAMYWQKEKGIYFYG